MNDFITKYSRNSIIISVLIIVFSLFLIFSPTVSITIIVVIIGIILAANGIMHILTYFSSPKELKMFSFELAIGVILLLVGLVFIFKPEIINSFLAFIIGTWVILKSITSIQLALNMKNSTDKWHIPLILAIFTFIIGIVMLFNPFATSSILVSACGTVLLLSEIANIIEVSTFKKYVK